MHVVLNPISLLLKNSPYFHRNPFSNFLFTLRRLYRFTKCENNKKQYFIAVRVSWYSVSLYTNFPLYWYLTSTA